MYDSPQSKHLIPKFIVENGVDTSELPLPLSAYNCLNEFFCRELTAGSRPIEPAGERVILPCDCRISVFEHISEYNRWTIKGNVQLQEGVRQRD